MSAVRLTDFRLLVGIGLLTVLLVAAGAVIEPPAGPAAAAPSSFSASPGGGKAAYLTLRELGYRVERSFEPLTALRVDPRETTLILTGPVQPSRQDERALQEFLRAGGIALLTGPGGADLLGVRRVERPAPFAPVATHRALAASPLALGAGEITMPPAGEAGFGPEYVPVFADADTRPLVVTAVIDGGRAIWLAAPTPLMNEQIARARNLQFLLNVVGAPGERLVLWDEHYHGYGRSLWSYAANTPLPWILAQAALLALAAVAVVSRRSGPVRARLEDPRTSPLEFIEMLQALYRRADAAPAAVASALHRFRRALTMVAGVPGTAADDVAARAAAAKLGLTASDVLQLLEESRRAAGEPRVEETAALALTARLQELIARLQDVRQSGGVTGRRPDGPGSRGAARGGPRG
ncbi:MAG TPA: DUF4350 domain-containing protein [Vicinamibacterales bacterium]|nr:DUF4350 domain-containing protein [Vicinamibacterales bacterium]